MSNYRIKFLSLWSAIMDEERWNGWAPLCECGSNFCTFKPSGNVEDMILVIEVRPIEY